MKKAIIGILAGILVIGGSILVFGQKGFDGGKGMHRGPGGPGGPGMMLRGLDLTDEQKAKVKEIFDASRSTVEPIMSQLRENHQKLAALGTAGTFDQAQVEALAAEQGRLTAQMVIEKERSKAQVFALLTDEQRAKAAELRTKFEEKMKERKGFRHGPQGSEF